MSRLNMFASARLSLIAPIVLLAAASPIHGDDLGFKAPAGFEVSLYADDALAHDIFSITVDVHGRIVTAGEGYVKTLHDSDGDGRADRATLFSNFPKGGARGLYFDGNDLICSGDKGVWRLVDRDGDGVADGQPVLLVPNSGNGDHAANGIIRGPDGWYYQACGNDAGVNASHAASPGSPVKRVICGGIVRISPDGKTSDVYAHGFRNPYDIDFNAFGNVFTVDADGERDHHLPWYAPNRLFDIAQGMEHGWILKGWSHAWNRPESNCDNVQRLVEIGRGSPTGVVVYRHRRFPERYRDGVFSICWTYGRIYFFPLTRSGSTYRGQIETFMETSGDVGFAPVDMAVDPEGDLFVAIGGRATRGGVFRVRYQGPLRPRPIAHNPVRTVLAADQPLSSWSRAQWVPQAQRLGKKAFENGVLDEQLPLEERIRALEILVELFGGVSADLSRKVAVGADPELAARSIWAASRSPDDAMSRQFIATMTHQDDARIARASWEALAALPSLIRELDPPPDWFRGLDHSDRRVRAATILAARGPGRASFDVAAASAQPLRTSRQILGHLQVCGPVRAGIAGWQSNYFHSCAGVFLRDQDPIARLDAVRLLQMGLGDVKLTQGKAAVFDGYVGSSTEQVDTALWRFVVTTLSPAFPTPDAELNRELARLLAMLSADEPGLLSRLTTLWTEQGAVEDDIHYLIVASKLPGSRTTELTARTAAALTRLHVKMAAGRKEPSRFWPIRVGEIFERLLERDPALGAALVADSTFGLAEHSLFVKLLRQPERQLAARRMLVAALAREQRNEPAWTPEMVALLAVLPAEEVLPVLRRLWGNFALRDTIAYALTEHPSAEDSDRFVEALQSLQANVVMRAADALTSLATPGTPKKLKAAMEALNRFCAVKSERAVREALSKLLQLWSGQEMTITGSDDPMTAFGPWFDWFSRTHPRETAELRQANDTGVGVWKTRLTDVNWQAGEAERGRHLFEERACHRCHLSSSRLGPDLSAVTARFSREDLFIAIVDPSRDISPAYASKEIVTKSGATYNGMLVYDSPTARLLQTTPDTTVRVAGDDVVEVKTSRVSLMPNGLLNGLSDQGLADLYAYLKTLQKK